MADVTSEKTVYVVWSRVEWPLNVFEHPAHAIEAFKRQQKDGHKPHITRCRLVPVEELQLVRAEEHLAPVNEAEHATT